MLLLLGFQFAQVIVQAVETLLPRHTVFLNPISDLLERSCLDAARAPLPGSGTGDKSSILKYFDVLGHSGKCHLKRLGKLRDGRFTGHQVRQDCPASGIGKGG
jgi:hypothetical protein